MFRCPVSLPVNILHLVLGGGCFALQSHKWLENWQNRKSFFCPTLKGPDFGLQWVCAQPFTGEVQFRFLLSLHTLCPPQAVLVFACGFLIWPWLTVLEAESPACLTQAVVRIPCGSLFSWWGHVQEWVHLTLEATGCVPYAPALLFTVFDVIETFYMYECFCACVSV